MKNMLKLFVLCLLVFGCDEKVTNNFIAVTDGGEAQYLLKKAQEPEELMKGLMNVKSMPENEGMIFDLRGIAGASMWMKDTLIPLDMVFADESGKVVWIFENATPMSEDLITPTVPFGYVIELNGGQVAKHKIKIGDQLKHEFFNNFDVKK